MKPDINIHYSNVRRVLLIVLILNLAVAAAKIIYGFLTKCSSMTADGFHSASDGISNVIGFVGLYLSSRPKDEGHPYGHKKYETLFALGISASLFLIAFSLAKESFSRFAHPVTPSIGLSSFMIMILTLGVNVWVVFYESRKGRELKSDILIADCMHTRTDILTSISVIFALIFIKIGYPIFDPIVTLIITLFIGYAAFSIARQESSILCDAAAIVDTEKIENIAMSIDGVKSCHKIRTRGRPDDIHIDLHIQAAPDTRLDKAHKISYAVEESIKKGIPYVADVLVHIEPAGNK